METKDAPYTYKIDTRIRDKYHSGYKRRDNEVTHFIVHGTGGGNSAEGNISWMLSGGYIGNGVYRKSLYRSGVALFQYIIDRDGTIIELINPHNFVYHSSTGGSSTLQTGFDRHTIGIELTNPNRANGGFYTVKQYKALAWLYMFLQERFPLMVNIDGHGAIKKEKTGKYKNCPGSGFDWKKFNEYFSVNNIKTNLGKEKIEVI